MGLFGKKRDKTVDLTERYMKQRERMANLRENARDARGTRDSSRNSWNAPGSSRNEGAESVESVSVFGFLDNASSSPPNSSENQSSGYQTYGYSESSGYGEDSDTKRKLAKRLMDITDKLEEISNQIYHLQQRVELLEKKINPSGY